MKEFLLNSFSHQSIMIQGVNIYLAMCHVVATANHQPVSTNRAMPCSIRECKWGQMKRYFSCITEVPLDLAHDMHKSFKYFEGVKLTSIGSISPPDSSLSSSSLSLADLFFCDSSPDMTRVSWKKYLDRSQAWARALKPTMVVLTAATGAPN